MIEQKYIVFTDGTVDIFSTRAIHSIVAGDRKALSAGRVALDENNFPLRVYGESSTLGVKSRPEDLQIIRQSLSN